jgi:hypothetical protein
VNDAAETPDPEEQPTTVQPRSVESVYSGSGPREFAGVVLQPWTGRRRTAAFELGLKGDGSTLDPIRVLFSCAMDQSDIFKVFRRPDQVVEKMLAWAEKNECADPTQANYEQAITLGMEIIEEVQRSEFKPADKKGPPPAGN